MIIINDEKLKQQLIESVHLDQALPSVIFTQMKLCQFDAHEYICVEFEPLANLYFMLKGKCMVTKLLSNGKRNLISFYEGFTLFGEIELIENTMASCSVEVLESALCLVIPHEPCRKILLADIQFMNRLCSFFTQKMRHNDHNASITQHCTTEEKLASYIISTQRNHQFRENHTQLAEYLGCSHRQLLRALKQFCLRGWLKKTETGYQLICLDELKAAANDIYMLDNEMARIFIGQ